LVAQKINQQLNNGRLLLKPLQIGSYYKKEAVCYEGGAIKVLFPVEKKKWF
jgi:hypothetical protein